MPDEQNLVELFEQVLLAVDQLEAQRLLAEAGTTLTPMQLVDEVIADAVHTWGRYPLGWVAQEGAA